MGSRTPPFLGKDVTLVTSGGDGIFSLWQGDYLMFENIFGGFLGWPQSFTETSTGNRVVVLSPVVSKIH